MKLKNILLSFATSLAATTLLGTQLWATSLSFVPSASTIGVGESTSVDIVIDGLEGVDLYGFGFLEPADLAAFSFEITYDDTVLTIDSYSFGTGLGEALNVDFLDDSKGHNGFSENYELAQLSLLWPWDFSSQADSFTLATLNITGLSLGQSSLGFNNVVLGDSWGGEIDATDTNTDITVAAPVPEPSTILLFGAGIACLAGFRRRNNSKKNAPM